MGCRKHSQNKTGAGFGSRMTGCVSGREKQNKNKRLATNDSALVQGNLPVELCSDILGPSLYLVWQFGHSPQRVLHDTQCGRSFRPAFIGTHFIHYQLNKYSNHGIRSGICMDYFD